MFVYLFYFCILGVLFQNSNGDSTSIGTCPEVEAMPGFNMNKFLGLWFAIQKTASASSCLRYELLQKEPGKYNITEIEPHSPLLSGLRHEHHSTGILTVPDPAEPGCMKLDLPYDIGSTKFIVFMSDYDNYAAIFTCKKYPIIHRWSAAILSRNKSLDMEFVDKVRIRLSSYNIDPFTLSIVSQKDCPKPEDEGVIYKTISTTFKNMTKDFMSVVL